MNIDESRIFLVDFVDLLTAFLAFNIAYFNSDQFRRVFNRMKNISSSNLEQEAAAVLKVIKDSEATEELKEGLLKEITLLKRVYNTSIKNVNVFLAAQKKLKLYFILSAFYCLLLVILGGYENTFSQSPNLYNYIFYANMTFIVLYTSHSIGNMIHTFFENQKWDDKKPNKLVLFLKKIPSWFILLLFMIIWGAILANTFEHYFFVEIKKISQFSANTALIVALLPYITDVIIACIAYFKGRSAYKKAKTELNKQEAFVQRANELVQLQKTPVK